MKCKKCGSEMRLDDKVFFVRFTDFYYDCDECFSSCLIRLRKPNRELLKEEWRIEP